MIGRTVFLFSLLFFPLSAPAWLLCSGCICRIAQARLSVIALAILSMACCCACEPEKHKMTAISSKGMVFRCCISLGLDNSYGQHSLAAAIV